MNTKKKPKKSKTNKKKVRKHEVVATSDDFVKQKRKKQDDDDESSDVETDDLTKDKDEFANLGKVRGKMFKKHKSELLTQKQLDKSVAPYFTAFKNDSVFQMSEVC